MRKHEQKQQKREEAAERSDRRLKLLNDKNFDPMKIFVGLKERVKRGIFTKKEALDLLKTKEITSSTIEQWIRNFVPPKKKVKRKRKVKKNDKRGANTQTPA